MVVSLNCLVIVLEIFVGFDVGSDGDDDAVDVVVVGGGVNLVVFVADVVDVDVVDTYCCCSEDIYYWRHNFCRVSCHLCFPSWLWGDEECNSAGIHHMVGKYILQ